MEQMNIISAKYVSDEKTGDDFAIQATIDGIEMSVPLDPANRHYAAILKAVEAGELVIEEADTQGS